MGCAGSKQPSNHVPPKSKIQQKKPQPVIAAQPDKLLLEPPRLPSKIEQTKVDNKQSSPQVKPHQPINYQVDIHTGPQQQYTPQPQQHQQNQFKNSSHLPIPQPQIQIHQKTVTGSQTKQVQDHHLKESGLQLKSSQQKFSHAGSLDQTQIGFLQQAANADTTQLTQLIRNYEETYQEGYLDVYERIELPQLQVRIY